MATTPLVTRRASFKQVIDISTEELILLHKNHIELVAAPGVGKALVINDILIEGQFLGSAFAGTGALAAYLGPIDADPTQDTLSIVFSSVPDASVVKAVTHELDTGRLNKWAGNGFAYNGNNFVDTSLIENQPICLYASTKFADTGVGALGISVVHTPGTAFAVGDTGEINAGNPKPTYVITAVDEVNGVAEYTIKSYGKGLSRADNVALVPGGAQAGVGTNATLDILTVLPVDSKLRVTTMYSIFDILSSGVFSSPPPPENPE